MGKKKNITLKEFSKLSPKKAKRDYPEIIESFLKLAVAIRKLQERIEINIPLPGNSNTPDDYYVFLKNFFYTTQEITPDQFDKLEINEMFKLFTQYKNNAIIGEKCRKGGIKKQVIEYGQDNCTPEYFAAMQEFINSFQKENPNTSITKVYEEVSKQFGKDKRTIQRYKGDKKIIIKKDNS